jgi:hypothetical protein
MLKELALVMMFGSPPGAALHDWQTTIWSAMAGAAISSSPRIRKLNFLIVCPFVSLSLGESELVFIDGRLHVYESMT